MKKINTTNLLTNDEKAKLFDEIMEMVEVSPYLSDEFGRKFLKIHLSCEISEHQVLKNGYLTVGNVVNWTIEEEPLLVKMISQYDLLNRRQKPM
jgi:hypothetical protein